MFLFFSRSTTEMFCLPFQVVIPIFAGLTAAASPDCGGHMERQVDKLKTLCFQLELSTELRHGRRNKDCLSNHIYAACCRRETPFHLALNLFRLTWQAIWTWLVKVKASKAKNTASVLSVTPTQLWLKVTVSFCHVAWHHWTVSAASWTAVDIFWSRSDRWPKSQHTDPNTVDKHYKLVKPRF